MHKGKSKDILFLLVHILYTHIYIDIYIFDVHCWLNVATFPGDCGSKIFRAICISGFPVLVQMAEASHCNPVAKIAEGEEMA